MPRSYTVTRTLAAALAIGALAAPAASARLIQDPPASNANDGTAQSHRGKDLRMPDTKDAAAQSQRGKDLRMPDTKDAAEQSQRAQDRPGVLAGSHIHTSSLAGTTDRGPVYWAYDHPAPDPKSAAALAQERYYSTSVRPAPVQQPATPGGTDDGTPWALIGLGLAGAALAAAGTAGFAGKTRLRARRERVAA